MRNLSGRKVDVQAVAEAARRALAAENASLSSLSVALVDDERVSQVNERFLSRRGPTDVIAFEAEQGEGEVIISVETAERQAEDQGCGLADELCYLVVHGVLHVLGYDDLDGKSRARMLGRQDEILGR